MMLRQPAILLTVTLQVEVDWEKSLFPLHLPEHSMRKRMMESLNVIVRTRTPVTLTLHPPLAIAAASVDQSVCAGGDPASIDGGVASGGTGTYTYHGNRQRHRQVPIHRSRAH